MSLQHSKPWCTVVPLCKPISFSACFEGPWVRLQENLEARFPACAERWGFAAAWAEVRGGLPSGAAADGWFSCDGGWANCLWWSEGASGGLVQLLLSTGLLPALKVHVKRRKKKVYQRYCCIITEGTLGNANSERQRWKVCCCQFLAPFLWEFKRKWILLKWPFFHLLLALEKPVLPGPSTQTLTQIMKNPSAHAPRDS